MMHINPKVVGFILLVIVIGALAYWASEERFEVNPPTPDAEQIQ